MKQLRRALVLFLIACLPTGAGEFWLEKDYTRWSKKECQKMLEDSPWARSYILRFPLIEPGTGIMGEKELRVEYIVRFLSALPIRQALVRAAQLEPGYKMLAAEGRQQFEQRAQQWLQAQFPDVVVLMVAFDSNVPDLQQDAANYWARQTTETLQNYAYLIAHRKERVPLLRFDAPAPGTTQFRLLFPRRHNGRELISPEDKEINLELLPPGTASGRTFGFLLRFKVDEMSFNGVLTY